MRSKGFVNPSLVLPANKAKRSSSFSSPFMLPISRVLLFSFFFCISHFAYAQPKSPFPEAKHGKGTLKHIDGIAVLTCQGTPAEIGEQYGILVGKNAANPTPVLEQFLKDVKKSGSFPVLKVLAQRMKSGFPKDHLVELEAAQKASGFEIEMMLFVNTVYDLSTGMGCSTLIAEKERSKTGAPLFGRNFDWMPSRGLPEQTIVAIMKPENKRAFAIVTFSPIMGCISGMNDAGLACTINEIHLKQSQDKPVFNWDGTPTMLAFRRVLEECKTVAEAEKLLRSINRTTTACLTICDPNGGAVFEITPKSIEVRKAVNDICCCTNHFCTKPLGIPQECERLDQLLLTQKSDAKLDVKDVFSRLHDVHQGKFTMQSMVFEPAERKLHLKIGDGKSSATEARMVTLDLGKLMK